MRIVSLLPSATEIVCALGLQDQLVGVTHECDYPQSVQSLPRVTRTLIPVEAASSEIDRLVSEQLKATKALYQLDLPLLKELRPDVIVTQSLCDVCGVSPSDVQMALAQLSGAPHVVNLEPQSLDGLFEAIRHVASVVDVSAEDTIQQLRGRVEAVAMRSAGVSERPRVTFLEWLDPPFSSGHWNPELVRIAGGIEGLGKEGQPSRRLRWDEVFVWQPDVIVIACCGFTVERAQQDLAGLQSVAGWRELPAVRSGRVYVADGSHYFNRPGPRLVESLELIAHAIHPDRHQSPIGLPALHRVASPQYS
ncbi:MAG: cobalamin-binding protein [Nitrospira sp.]|nr:cobalamin-binding protein [Nitrospira sp.]MBH0181658.1 cobalamin-binding protein [Nitrospira sp.]MBH0184245.1 cobalamin-binding protein [Nitrospira sp.]